MTMFNDRATVSGARLTADGYLVADARIARTGVQVYRGDEVGRPDLVTVRLYRPPEEVFSDATMRSFAHRPVTVDHPTEKVDATTWKKVAAGQIGDQVTRDGEFVRVPMTLMDAAAIAAWQAGKRELSAGYTAQIVFGDGQTPEGEPYDAIMTGIVGNHLALVDKARGGPQLRLDSAPPPAQVFDSAGFRARLVEQFKDAQHLAPTEVESIINQLTANAAAGHRSVADSQPKDQAFADQYRQHRQVSDSAYAEMCAGLQSGSTGHREERPA